MRKLNITGGYRVLAETGYYYELSSLRTYQESQKTILDYPAYHH